MGGAKKWFRALPPGKISQWEELEDKFLSRYFVVGKFLDKLKGITSFRQHNNEALWEAYNRFQLMLKRCRTHGLDEVEQIQFLIQGVKENVRTLLEISAGGKILSTTGKELRSIMEVMVANEHQEMAGRKGALDEEYDCNQRAKQSIEKIREDLEKWPTLHSIGEQQRIQEMESLKRRIEGLSSIFLGNQVASQLEAAAIDLEETDSTQKNSLEQGSTTKIKTLYPLE